MIPDLVTCYNLALDSISADSRLTSVTEKDRGAERCNLWYPVVLDQVLRGAPWPSARKQKRLALVATKSSGEWVVGDPEPGFTYCFAPPADMLYPQYLAGFGRFTLSARDDGTQVINTNDPAPVLFYTFRQDVPLRWEPSLGMAIAYGLGANIAMPMTGKAQRAASVLEKANSLILMARVEAANEGMNFYETIPDWIAARGYSNPGDSRYYYPFGPLLGMN